MERKTTSIKVSPDLWKEVKKEAIDRGTEVSELVETALRKELQKK
jgi:post-segregation antitoxin (ccd killing protein)